MLLVRAPRYGKVSGVGRKHRGLGSTYTLSRTHTYEAYTTDSLLCQKPGCLSKIISSRRSKFGDTVSDVPVQSPTPAHAKLPKIP